MVLLLLEALGAGLVLVLIVWWTMFSGRKGGERPDAPVPPAAEDAESATRRQAAQKPDRADH
jgi:hypothetical protein